MAKFQYRKSISFAPEDYILVKKLCKKLDIGQTMLLAALVRTEAKKRRLKVTEAEVEAFKEELRNARVGSRTDAQERAAKLFPDAFK